MRIEVDKETCTRCSTCIKYCSFGAIHYEEGVPDFDGTCVFCGACMKSCPVDAISINRKVREKDLSSYSGVLAFVETSGGSPRNVGIEMVAAARNLADKLGESCSAMVIGTGGDRISGVLHEYGADVTYVVENEGIREYSTELYTNIVAGLVSRFKPSIVLLGATHLGRDLAPRVAARLDTGLTADCTELDVDEKGNLLQTRPTFGGSILATIVTPHHRPQMATVRPNVIKRLKYTGAADRGEPRTVSIPVKIDPSRLRVKLLRDEKEAAPFSNVEEADYIVSGGKGVGRAENFKFLEDLVRAIARVTGDSRVSLGASRAAVDAGWIAHQHQVGQTGKVVTPKLYIACGISGQLQHIMGMRESAKIIAINTDRNAPIFRVADLCLVGDVREIVPLITQHISHASDRPAEGDPVLEGARTILVKRKGS